MSIACASGSNQFPIGAQSAPRASEPARLDYEANKQEPLNTCTLEQLKAPRVDQAGKEITARLYGKSIAPSRLECLRAFEQLNAPRVNWQELCRRMDAVTSWEDEKFEQLKNVDRTANTIFTWLVCGAVNGRPSSEEVSLNF